MCAPPRRCGRYDVARGGATTIQGTTSATPPAMPRLPAGAWKGSLVWRRARAPPHANETEPMATPHAAVQPPSRPAAAIDPSLPRTATSRRLRRLRARRRRHGIRGWSVAHRHHCWPRHCPATRSRHTRAASAHRRQRVHAPRSTRASASATHRCGCLRFFHRPKFGGGVYTHACGQLR